jgi:hypothetical protein
MPQCSTDQYIEDLVVATCGEGASLRQAHVMRQSLQGLVRLAKVEQLLDIRRSVARLTGVDAIALRRRHTKAILKGIAQGCNARQQQFEFDGDDKPL